MDAFVVAFASDEAATGAGRSPSAGFLIREGS
jgi:hypothetical protein